MEVFVLLYIFALENPHSKSFLMKQIMVEKSFINQSRLWIALQDQKKTHMFWHPLVKYFSSKCQLMEQLEIFANKINFVLICSSLVLRHLA